MSSSGLRVDQLAGFRVGVTSDRRADDLISALERRGAQVFHAPALRIAPHDQDQPLVAETRRLIAARPDVVMITTGYGMRRWFEVADANGLGAELTAVLDDATILARGPKAVGAVRAAGLEDARASEHVTTASMVDDLIERGLVDRRVAIQLHGYTDEVQLDRLRGVSASVLTVTPYRWVRPTTADRLPRLIEALCSRQLDAVTFTSAPGAEATLAAAAELGRLDELVDALQTDVVAAAVGPITAAPLREAGVPALTPDRYRLGALIRLVCDTLSSERVQRLRCGELEIEVRGRAVTRRRPQGGAGSERAVPVQGPRRQPDGGLPVRTPALSARARRRPRAGGCDEPVAPGAERTGSDLDRGQAWLSSERVPELRLSPQNWSIPVALWWHHLGCRHGPQQRLGDAAGDGSRSARPLPEPCP